ncbi:putative metal-sulfur cluster biosynthetic enzyme [Burkholderia sp. Ch1-1]|uniref:Putative metal-sulfur cluster biosynthetic enzyme n=1 Tax=Paraburkholderia dioscoreae TaxID=2604047 RepID=A0A5Q4Z6A0_9BURK|nr:MULTISPECIES: iron-sulfur cluster assembly protein [Paraburkholderia]EIF31662.1 putative metal-sulfur cluster biosynthetic enzyme [Burkholderia sp. Ch1-1]MDR8398018.1 iron-sulfur cluster assembly protein [Paraburkholderia sp. USG1]VVD28059.1 putative metal-sulfur cluster biosynthetic enzyme [Paraburkholderia dioscoreae]
MIGETQVRAALNGIIDPCSVAAGCAAGLDDMGLVRRVELAALPHGMHVTVTVAVTEYGCLMGAPFASEAYRTLSALPGVASVDVKLDDQFDWDPLDMSESYRDRLVHHRRIRGGVIPIRPLPGTSPCSGKAGAT